MANFFYNGKLYKVILESSNPFYGRDTVWKIYTDEESHSTAKRAIVENIIQDDKVPSKGLYDYRVELGKFTIEDSIRGWYKVDYDEAEDCFILQRHQGYDD